MNNQNYNEELKQVLLKKDWKKVFNEWEDYDEINQSLESIINELSQETLLELFVISPSFTICETVLSYLVENLNYKINLKEWGNSAYALDDNIMTNIIQYGVKYGHIKLNDLVLYYIEVQDIADPDLVDDIETAIIQLASQE